MSEDSPAPKHSTLGIVFSSKLEWVYLLQEADVSRRMVVLNGIGGYILLPGESYEDCMIRSGIGQASYTGGWTHFGILRQQKAETYSLFYSVAKTLTPKPHAHLLNKAQVVKVSLEDISKLRRQMVPPLLLIIRAAIEHHCAPENERFLVNIRGNS